MGWIKFKGESSEKYGIMKQVPFIPTAERTVDTIEIPGSTPVTIKKGYKRIITPVFTLGIKRMSQENIYNIYDWLHGEGQLITSREPDKYFKAQIYSALTTRHLSQRLGELDFQFSCDSFRYAVINPMQTVDFDDAEGANKRTIIKNPGNVIAYPEFEVSADGPFVIWIDSGRYFSFDKGGTYTINVEYASMMRGDEIVRVDPGINLLYVDPGDHLLSVTKSVTTLKMRKNARWH